MKQPKAAGLVVHCILCGKDFRAGDDATCGGLYNGCAMCKTGDIKREMDSRLPGTKAPSNA